MSDARKCLHCGGDVLDEEASHCSAACLRKATHIITDQIVDGGTKDLLAMRRDKTGEQADNVRHDPVNHPSHYTAYKGLEVIDLTEQMNFNRGNAVKYICRAGLKDPATEIQDLEKAVWYLNREIARLVDSGGCDE